MSSQTQNSKLTPRWKCWATSVVLFSLGVSASGCEVAGVLLHSAIGEPPINAQYVPPKVPTLVLVENYNSPDAVQLDGDQISHMVAEELHKHAELEIIDSDKLVPLREEDPNKYHAMTYQAIGRAVGAKQIILVDLLESAVTSDISGAVVHASARAQIRVIDVASSNTLWPADASHGRELDAKIDYDPTETSHAMAMHTDMLTSLSSRIAKLFYRWSPDNQDQENTGG